MCSIWILDSWKEQQTEEFLGLVRGPFVLTCNPFMVGAKFKWEYFRDTQCSCTLQWQSGLEIMCGDKSSPRPGPILRYCRVSICCTEARVRVSIGCISPQLWTANVQMCVLCRRRWWRGGGYQINCTKDSWHWELFTQNSKNYRSDEKHTILLSDLKTNIK